MPFNDRAYPPNTPIPLDSAYLQTHGRDETERAIRRIVRSVKFELIERENAVRLLGPEMSYHGVDPYLPDVLKRFGNGMTLADVLSYKSIMRHFDLCFEDSWTGYFIAKRFQEHGQERDLVLIHLDDHTDMMPTLLSSEQDTLTDPTTGAVFDPRSSTAWESAIHSGAVNIGNYITPFYYSGSNIHVFHLNNTAGRDELRHVARSPCRYDLIPHRQFASIETSSAHRSDSVGTYLVGSSADWVLSSAPRAWTLVHIDLDYFINDFNGDFRGETYLPDPRLRTQAERKMDGFFGALDRLNPTVDRWIIGTSPGFCSAFHWGWLLARLGRTIQEFQAGQN